MPPRLPPLPLAPPPQVLPMRVRSAALTAASVSSLTVDDPSLEGDTLLLAYGVNDCAAKIAEISLQRVWEMLTPLPGVDAARLGEGCFPTTAGRRVGEEAPSGGNVTRR